MRCVGYTGPESRKQVCEETMAMSITCVDEGREERAQGRVLTNCTVYGLGQVEDPAETGEGQPESWGENGSGRFKSRWPTP